MTEILHKELSYKIMGAIFKVYNSLGYGYQEKDYQKAIISELQNQKIAFKEQVLCDMIFNNQVLAKYFLDILVENKIVIELKVRNIFYKRDYEQIRNYLKINHFDLGILVLFSKKGIKFKRILNKNIRIDSDINSD